MTGFQLMSKKQQVEWIRLVKLAMHLEGSKLSVKEVESMREYEKLYKQLEIEYLEGKGVVWFGVIALKISGERHRLAIVGSAAGFYIGTKTEDGLPLSRESVEYWENFDDARRALGDGNWTQRDEP